jgi:hypothetical protein
MGKALSLYPRIKELTMKKIITYLCIAALAICMPQQMLAQKNENANHEDSYYLKGAVPEVNGKVVFSKEFSIPGMSKGEVYNITKEWMDARMQQNANKSRLAFSDEEKGQLAANGEEHIVFSNNALSLDRTKVMYQMLAYCDEGKCVLEIKNIRYDYPNEKEIFLAEDWITDEVALTKDQTKLHRGFAKWRRKTVDWVDDMDESLQKALSGFGIVKSDGKPEETRNSDAVAVVDSRVKVEEVKPVVEETKPVQEAIKPVVEAPQPQESNEMFPELTADKIIASNGRLVIIIGEDEFNRTTMTANAGGYLSTKDGKKFINTILTPEQSYQALEQAKDYMVAFYPNGAQQPSVVMKCQNVTKEKPGRGRANIFIGEITSVEMH